MAKKRDTSDPEAFLQSVIAGLESEVEGKRRSAVELLFSVDGPMICGSLDDVDHATVREDVIEFLRSLVREGHNVGTSGLTIVGPVTVQAMLKHGTVRLWAEGPSREVGLVNLLLVLDRVGLRNVRVCHAPDCGKLFVKKYGRDFCSLRCQKRDNKRRQRQNQRDAIERQRERRRQRAARRRRSDAKGAA